MSWTVCMKSSEKSQSAAQPDQRNDHRDERGAITELTVRDMAGRTVLCKAVCGATSTPNTSTLRKGVYLVKVTTACGTTTKNLVVE